MFRNAKRCMLKSCLQERPNSDVASLVGLSAQAFVCASFNRPHRFIMAEAEAVYRYESGNIAHAPKKDYGPLDFTGKLAGGLRLDIRRRAPFYCSDWTDAFTPENFQKSVSSILYLFSSPAISRLFLFDFFQMCCYSEGAGDIFWVLAICGSKVHRRPCSCDYFRQSVP